jgi:hypothetical protein
MRFDSLIIARLDDLFEADASLQYIYSAPTVGTKHNRLKAFIFPIDLREH